MLRRHFVVLCIKQIWTWGLVQVEPSIKRVKSAFRRTLYIFGIASSGPETRVDFGAHILARNLVRRFWRDLQISKNPRLNFVSFPYQTGTSVPFGSLTFWTCRYFTVILQKRVFCGTKLWHFSHISDIYSNYLYRCYTLDLYDIWI